jgi:hypothetical protein
MASATVFTHCGCVDGGGWKRRDGRSMRASFRAYVKIIVSCMFRWAQSRRPGVASHAPPFASSGLQGRRLRQHPVQPRTNITSCLTPPRRRHHVDVVHTSIAAHNVQLRDLARALSAVLLAAHSHLAACAAEEPSAICRPVANAVMVDNVRHLNRYSLQA